MFLMLEQHNGLFVIQLDKGLSYKIVRRPFSLEMFITFLGTIIACDYYPTETRSHSVAAHGGT